MANELPAELPAVKTPIDVADLYPALGAAWFRYFGTTAPHKSLLVLLAQSALETGRWRSCWCYNLGNAKHVANDGRSWCYYRCNELINGQWIWFDPPSQGCCFRAFESLEDGAIDYLRLLIKQYAAAWPAVLLGDAAAFVEQLKRSNYFTAPLAPYRASVVSIYNEFARDIPAVEAPELTDDERAENLRRVELALREDYEGEIAPT
jgi:hypothetical protein